MSNQDPTPETIEELRARYQQLHERRIQARARLEGAEQQLETLRAEAREDYGTDDLAELESLLEKMTAENEAARRGYQASLDGVERELQEIERSFQADDADADTDPETAP